MFRPGNVATPATGAAVVVPESSASSSPVPSVITNVLLPAKLVAAWPDSSCTVTCMVGFSWVPAGLALGCTVNTSRNVAAGVPAGGPAAESVATTAAPSEEEPGVISNAALVASASPAAVAGRGGAGCAI